MDGGKVSTDELRLSRHLIFVENKNYEKESDWFIFHLLNLPIFSACSVNGRKSLLAYCKYCYRN